MIRRARPSHAHLSSKRGVLCALLCPLPVHAHREPDVISVPLCLCALLFYNSGIRDGFTIFRLAICSDPVSVLLHVQQCRHLLIYNNIIYNNKIVAFPVTVKGPHWPH